MKRLFLLLLLSTALACDAAPAPKPEAERLPFPTPTEEAKRIGPGTELAYDDGYFPGFSNGRELPWVTLPTTLVVVGETDPATNEILRRPPWLVCVRKGDKPPYDRFWIFSKTNLRGAKIIKLVEGKLPEVSPNVPIDKDQ